MYINKKLIKFIFNFDTVGDVLTIYIDKQLYSHFIVDKIGVHELEYKNFNNKLVEVDVKCNREIESKIVKDEIDILILKYEIVN